MNLFVQWYLSPVSLGICSICSVTGLGNQGVKKKHVNKLMLLVAFGLPLFLATDPETRVRFPALPDFLRSSGSGTGSTQPCEYN
jgi:hypothetical protein